MTFGTVARALVLSVFSTALLAISVVSSDGSNPLSAPVPDSVDVFQFPCEYPLVHEDSVEIRHVIKPYAFDLTPAKSRRSFPVRFDLRNVDGHNYVTPVKSQLGGTCWTHGTMASLESHILMSGRPWIAYQPLQYFPYLDEYHLDWWNGFNRYLNADILPQTGEGLEVHYGGDYLVAAAYFARNDGAVDRWLTSSGSSSGSYFSPAAYHHSTYDYYFPREIEWLTAGPELETVDVIKDALQTHGAVATAICWSSAFFNGTGSTFYQPPASDLLPNHSVTIVGWDDTLTTQAPQAGAWLCKNSWGEAWGQNGYFWVSYYDKVAGKHPEMGAVTVHDFEIVGFRKVYSHDYHGWRDTRGDCRRALNAFVVSDERMLSDASFITTVDDAAFTLEIFDDFEEAGGPSNLLASAQGFCDHIGLHTVTLDRQLKLRTTDDFFVSIQLSNGGMAYDRTSTIPVLLGPGNADALVRSKAAWGESYYWEAGGWHDLHTVDTTANFCIKAIADNSSPVGVSSPIGTPPLSATFFATWPDANILGCMWEFDDGSVSTELIPTHSFDRLGFHSVTLTMATAEGNITCLHKDVVAVQADTMTVTSATADATGVARVDLLLRNQLPLDWMVIPFSWAGPLDIVFDSLSVTGCRTQGVGEASLIGSSGTSRAAAVLWQSGPTAFLDQGEGPVLSLCFTVEGGSSSDANPVRIQGYNAYQPQLHCVGLETYLPQFVEGQIVFGCCEGRVGDADGGGVDEPTISDVSTMIDARFISGTCAGIIDCPAEADVNQSGGSVPDCSDITISDISKLIDYLFITGPTLGLPDCL